MSDLDLVALFAFRDELRKEGAGGLVGNVLNSPRLHSALGGAGALGGIGAAGGALVGAGVQGVRGYRGARAEGAGVGQALGAGAAGALGGAQKGAIVGGTAGLAAGGLGGALAPGRMEGARQALTGAGAGIGAAARFGQRQVHAVTGWRPGADASSVRQIGAGAHNAEQALGGAVDRANALHASGAPAAELARAAQGVESAQAGYKASFRAERAGFDHALVGRAPERAMQHSDIGGLSNVPGYLKSMKDNGVLPTLSTGFKEQWHSMSPGWKAVMVGAPLAETAHALRTPDQEGGPGKGERVARGLTGAVMGATMGSIPMATGAVLQHGLTGASGVAGRVVDRFRKPRQVFDASADASHGQVVPAERHEGTGTAGRPDATGGLS